MFAYSPLWFVNQLRKSLRTRHIVSIKSSRGKMQLITVNKPSVLLNSSCGESLAPASACLSFATHVRECVCVMTETVISRSIRMANRNYLQPQQSQTVVEWQNSAGEDKSFKLVKRLFKGFNFARQHKSSVSSQTSEL